MKRILAIALAATTCMSTNANPWLPFTAENYYLIPAEKVDIMAFANIHNGKISVVLSDASGKHCGKNEDSPVKPAGVFKVNEQFVRFIEACLNGKRMLAAESQAGKDFFADAITTKPTSVDIGAGVKLHFAGENFEAAKKTMIEAQSTL